LFLSENGNIEMKKNEFEAVLDLREEGEEAEPAFSGVC
jgi:hypothetical protein